MMLTLDLQNQDSSTVHKNRRDSDEYDMKEFAIFDPDGYVIAFAENHPA
jgi:hypothetical protein